MGRRCALAPNRPIAAAHGYTVTRRTRARRRGAPRSLPLKTPTQAARRWIQLVRSVESDALAAEVVLRRSDGLGHYVGDHLVGGDVLKVDLAAGNALAGKVVAHVDVLELDWIFTVGKLERMEVMGFLRSVMALWLSA